MKIEAYLLCRTKVLLYDSVCYLSKVLNLNIMNYVSCFLLFELRIYETERGGGAYGALGILVFFNEVVSIILLCMTVSVAAA